MQEGKNRITIQKSEFEHGAPSHCNKRYAGGLPTRAARALCPHRVFRARDRGNLGGRWDAFMSARYIGSKARVVEAILDLVGGPADGDSFFVDAFAGTGIVAEKAAHRGWPVRINDHLYCAVVMASARVLSTAAAPFEEFGGYAATLERLERVRPMEGFISREYSPRSAVYAGVERRYFTESNAARIDGMRQEIAAWVQKGVLAPAEERLLLADLLAASNRVANIAGTYGCFLRSWSPNALQGIRLAPRSLLPAAVPVETFNVDVYDVPVGTSDVVYFDPPYTKRQYAAYYHLLETIAVGDEPAVGGVTGLRPWREKASPFCYKVQALNAIVELLRDVESRHVFLSYSAEGHVRRDDLCRRLAELGELTVHDVAHVGRYRPNQVASNAGSRVSEYVLELVKAPAEELQEVP